MLVAGRLVDKVDLRILVAAGLGLMGYVRQRKQRTAA